MAPQKRIYVPFTDLELDEVDQWGFARRIRERSQAVRELVRIALTLKENEAAAGQAS